MASKCVDEAFTSRGFSNWKDAKVFFTKHEQISCHKEAVDAVVTVPSSYKDCAEMLSSQHAKKTRLIIDICCTKYYQVFNSWHAKVWF